MLTYREFLLHSLGTAQDCTFEQALCWMEAYEVHEAQKPKLRSRKKRANRLSSVLSVLQQAAPDHYQHRPNAKCQPVFRNPSIEAALPDEADSQSSDPVYASYRDARCDLHSIAVSIYLGWKKYHLMNATSVNAVYFSATSPRNTAGGLHQGRAEFETQAIQLTEIYTRMQCSDNPEQRARARTFQRPPHRVDYSKLLFDQLTPEHFSHDARYVRDGRPIAIFLPCAYWWDGEEAIEQFITWLIHQCKSIDLDFEIWQPGLIPEVRSGPFSNSQSLAPNP